MRWDWREQGGDQGLRENLQCFEGGDSSGRAPRLPRLGAQVGFHGGVVAGAVAGAKRVERVQTCSGCFGLTAHEFSWALTARSLQKTIAT